MMKGKGKRREMPVAAAAVAIALVVFACSAASAQPEVVTISDLIELSAEPASLAADGKSTSEITIAVSWPELEPYISQNMSGTPAASTPVIVETTLGVLTDAEDVNNTGTNITVLTGKGNGVATVLLSGSETGVANITARARGIESTVNDVLANNTTVYIVKTSTAVTLLEPGMIPTEPSGNGGGNGGGIPPAPPEGTSPYVNLAATPAEIPADGTSTSTLTASVWDGEEWVMANLTVNFSTSLGSITASAAIVNGTAIAVLTAGTEEGAANITAEVNLGGDIGSVTNTTTVNFTTPGATPAPPVVSPTPAATVSPTPAATVTPSPSPAPKPGIPGFEAVFVIAGLLAVAYMVLRRRGRRKE